MTLIKRPRSPMGVGGKTELPDGYDYKYKLRSDGWWVYLYDYHVFPRDLLAKAPVNLQDFEDACIILKKHLDSIGWS